MGVKSSVARVRDSDIFKKQKAGMDRDFEKYKRELDRYSKGKKKRK